MREYITAKMVIQASIGAIAFTSFWWIMAIVSNVVF